MVVQAVYNCPNCNTIMEPVFFSLEGENIPYGSYLCPLCRRVDIPLEPIRKWIELKLPKIIGYSPEVTKVLEGYREQILRNMGVK